MACVSVHGVCVCQVFLAGGAQLLQLQQDLIPRTSHLLSSYLLLQHTCQSLACALPLDIMYDPCYTQQIGFFIMTAFLNVSVWMWL